MATEITPAKIGRSMKNFDRFTLVSPRAYPARFGISLLAVCCCDGCALTGAPGARRCKPSRITRSPAFTPSVTTRAPSTSAPSATWRYSALLSRADDKDEALALVVADGAFRHQQRVVQRAAAHPHRDEHARHQAAVLIGEAGAGANGARAGVDAIVEAFDGAVIDMAAVALRPQIDRNLLLLGLGLGVVAYIVQIGLLVDLEIGIDAVVRDDGGQQRRRRGGAPDQIAQGDFGAADAAGDRRLDISVIDIQLGLPPEPPGRTAPPPGRRHRH